MGGEWRITQQPPHGTPGSGAGRGYRVDVIPMGDMTEQDMDFAHGIAFHHKDGRITIIPWAAIVRAEYVPDHADDQ